MNFEMDDLFAIADKPEMTRFDDPSVDWTDANFMQFITFNLIERIIIHHFFPVEPVKRITNGFQPGMIEKPDSEILMNFSFVNMHGKYFGSQ